MSVTTGIGGSSGVRNSPSTSQKLNRPPSAPGALGIKPSDLETGGEEGGTVLSPTDRSVQRVAQQELSWQEILLFSLPFLGTGFATRKIHTIYQHCVHEAIPMSPHGDEGPIITASRNMGACLTASIVSTLFTAFLLSKYLQGDILMFALGALALSTYAHIDGASRAQNTVYHLSLTSQRKSEVFSQ